MASEPLTDDETIRFGEDFELDLRAYELRRSGRVLKLERIPMDLLILLVRQRGELITREQIKDRIWGRDVFLDTDNSINGAIRKLRRGLKDDPDQPRFIQTIPGRGYRFIAPAMGAEPATRPASTNAPTIETGAIDEPVRGHRAVLLGLALLLIVTLGAWALWFRPAARQQVPVGPLTLAVLPFENLTGDPAQEYFNDGLTEEMISRLGSLDPQRLRVIARTSVTRYKRTQEPLARLARELGVQYVLEGSVRRSADRVRIAAQLIRVSDQTHVWARQYDRELTSLLAVQEELAEAVARQIEISLADKRGGVVPRGELSLATYEAYDLYLKGRYFWNKRTGEGFQQAVEQFQQAADRDPTYARAYAGLADSYALMSSYSMGPPTDLMPKARSAALRALELDDRLAEAHTSLALIHENFDWDWQAAEKEFRRAIQLDANYATAHHWYAEFLAFQGRFDEALAESERARQLDPLSLIIAVDRGAILYFARRHDRAIEQFRSVMAVDPNFPRTTLIMAAYLEKGMFREALAEAERWRRREEGPGPLLAEVFVYGRSGRLPEARKAFERFKHAIRGSRIQPAPAMSGAYLALGDKEKALDWLEQAYREHSNAMASLKVEPGCDPLRNEPRFQELLRRVGLDR